MPFGGDERTIGNLLAEQRTLSVPEYQREYSWRDEEVGDLWRDLTETLKDKSDHFLGIIVLVKKSTNEFEVIDGQQRLVTLLMLFATLREALRTLDNPHPNETPLHAEIQRKYFGSLDLRSRQWKPKFITNTVDDSLFKTCVIESPGRSMLRRHYETASVTSHRLMLNAMLVLSETLDQKLDQLSTTRERETYILDVIEHVEQRFKVMEMVATDDSTAFTIFETLNGRGLELTAMDLVKNRLYGKAGGRLATVKTLWEEAMRDLNDIPVGLQQQARSRFLRHHWVSQNGRVSAKNLYRAIRDKVNGEYEAYEFVREVRQSAEFYAALYNGEHQLWTSFSDHEARVSAAAIRDLESVQSFPVLIAALHVMRQGHMTSRETTRIFRLMLAMSVRYSLIGQRRTGVLDQIYADIAQQIYKRQLATAEAVFGKLEDIYPTDQEFLQDFCVREITQAEKARYILGTLERTVSGHMLVPTTDTSVISLEHVIPQRPGANWKRYAQEQGYEDSLSRWIYRIGNLTLLLLDPNQKFGNQSLFPKKRDEAYRVSQAQLTQQLERYSRWTPEEIQDRSEYLGQIAVRTWRFPER